jgi:spore germination protein KC
MKKCLLVSLVILMLTPILSACWNQKELTDLAFVMALGVDKGKDEKFELSFQFVIPANVSTGQTGGGGKGLPIAVAKSRGNTITEAARNVTKIVGRQVYYAHTNLVVISEEIAKEKDLLLDVFDALTRDPEFRRTTELVITRESSALDILSTLTLLERLPVNKIVKQIETSESMLGEDIKVNIDDFLSGIVSSGKEPIVTGYMIKGDKEKAKGSGILEKSVPDAFLKADGLAIFRDGELIGWINNKTARGVLWILDKIKSTDINLDWKDKKNAINYATIRSKTKVSVTFKNGKPIIHIKVENEGWISEANIDVDLTDPKELAKIEKKARNKIRKEIISSVETAQKQKTDIFGFGERVHRANPGLWRKFEGNWNERFAELEVNVKVASYIRRGGVRTNPFWSSLKK